MGIRTQVLGYPRIGAKRELKKRVEAYWEGKISQPELQHGAAELRRIHWQKQQTAGIDLIPSNDFSFYDHVLDTICLVGAIPERFEPPEGMVDLNTYFAMARGVRPGQKNKNETHAMEMTKWFNTNYHYIVPEFTPDINFTFASDKPIAEFKEAKQLGIQTQPVLLGPVSFLLLGKGTPGFDTLNLLDKILPVYARVLTDLAAAGAEWIQFDEPFLALDLTEAQQEAFSRAYNLLGNVELKLRLMLVAYFDEYRENLPVLLSLPIQGLHLDLVEAGHELDIILETLPADKVLSLGVVNGRNVWKNDYAASLAHIKKARQKLADDRLIISTSCSLMFSPVTLANETQLEAALKDWLTFADEKLVELRDLARLAAREDYAVDPVFQANQQAHQLRQNSTRIHVAAVQQRCAGVTPQMMQRKSEFKKRNKYQQARLRLPKFPTTTIGSFPQTVEIRKTRALYRQGKLNQRQYEKFLETEIKRVIKFQEEIGLDVLVHGECERNDMVEYFGEQLNGFVFTKNGWVQSYGSRCVKPPIIYGDVFRPAPMTIRWARFAQYYTDKPVKGMLTGPVTILQWSFVRDDQPRAETAKQIALAIRDEVLDLEKAFIPIIQIDEPALREGLPLRRSGWKPYLEWAVNTFRLAASGVKDETQIHTHMCYSEFNDIIEAIAAMDADVISIEASRSKMELLSTFKKYTYPNQIGPGVWDIHSPRIPTTREMEKLLEKAATVILPKNLWVNPDCGLKTRAWPEVIQSLKNMIAAAKNVRQKFFEG